MSLGVIQRKAIITQLFCREYKISQKRRIGHNIKGIKSLKYHFVNPKLLNPLFE